MTSLDLLPKKLLIMELLKCISSKRRWAIEKARDVTNGYINGVQPLLNHF